MELSRAEGVDRDSLHATQKEQRKSSWLKWPLEGAGIAKRMQTARKRDNGNFS
jgi:hypothetical protein